MTDEPTDDPGFPDDPAALGGDARPEQLDADAHAEQLDADAHAEQLDADAARERLLAGHGDAIARTLDCAAAVAAAFDATVDGKPASPNSRAVRGSLRTALDRAGLCDAFAELLPDVVDAAGATTAAPPVAGPPYVAVASTGPVLRATLGDVRLVVRIEAFAVVDGAFVWRDPSPRDAVRVEVRR